MEFSAVPFPCTSETVSELLYTLQIATDPLLLPAEKGGGAEQLTVRFLLKWYTYLRLICQAAEYHLQELVQLSNLNTEKYVLYQYPVTAEASSSTA